MASIVDRYIKNAGREKITKPNPIFQSWHPVAILILIPFIQLLISSLSS